MPRFDAKYRKLMMGGAQSSIAVLDTVPDEIIENFLSYLDGKFVACTASLVCKRWRDIIQKPSLWRQLCIHSGLCDPGKFQGITDYKTFYFRLSRNLIKNAWAEHELHYWTDVEAAESIKVEICRPKAVGCKPLVHEDGEVPARTADGKVRCWATTYFRCAKSQTVDLIGCGCTTPLLDEERPDIYVSEWTAARTDCASVYKIHVQLLDAEMKPLDEFLDEREEARHCNGLWHKVEYRFTRIPVGTRYVLFHHEGVDRQFWAGHYGSKFTGATVQLKFRQAGAV